MILSLVESMVKSILVIKSSRSFQEFVIFFSGVLHEFDLFVYNVFESDECYDSIFNMYNFIFTFHNRFLNNMLQTHVHLCLLSSMHNAHVTC